MTWSDPTTPRWRRPLWLAVEVLAVIALGLGIAAGVAGAPDSTPAAIQQSRPGAEPPPPNPEPEPTTVEPPSAAWTPCNTDLLDEECGDFFSDSCDGAHASYQDSGEAGLVDAFIENKDFIDEARLKDCPQFLPAWRKAKTGFAEGSLEVGKDVKAGTYKTTGAVSDCYWERGGANGHTIANSFITAAKSVRVTIHKSDEMFTTRGCGDWVRAE